MDKAIKEQIAKWEEFSKNKDFRLNPDKKKVELLAKGILNNKKNKKLGYCPCRLITKTKQDLWLICPCNFRSQKTWREKGECWCSLFVKR